MLLYEVYKKIKRERGESLARRCLAQLEKTQVIAMTRDVAVLAADLSLEHALPMADAIVLATARMQDAELITGNTDFEKVPGVRVL